MYTKIFSPLRSSLSPSFLQLNVILHIDNCGNLRRQQAFALAASFLYDLKGPFRQILEWPEESGIIEFVGHTDFNRILSNQRGYFKTFKEPRFRFRQPM
jgi:hypothetical protein